MRGRGRKGELPPRPREMPVATLESGIFSRPDWPKGPGGLLPSSGRKAGVTCGDGRELGISCVVQGGQIRQPLRSRLALFIHFERACLFMVVSWGNCFPLANGH